MKMLWKSSQNMANNLDIKFNLKQRVFTFSNGKKHSVTSKALQFTCHHFIARMLHSKCYFSTL